MQKTVFSKHICAKEETNGPSSWTGGRRMEMEGRGMDVEGREVEVEWRGGGGGGGGGGVMEVEGRGTEVGKD